MQPRPKSLAAGGTSNAADAQVSLQNVPIAQLVPATPTGVPVIIHAREQGDLYTLRGGVEIDYQDYVILADQVTYNTATGTWWAAVTCR